MHPSSPSGPSARSRRPLFAPRFPSSRRADSGWLVLSVWLLMGWATLAVATRHPVAVQGPSAVPLVAAAGACELNASC